MTAIHLSNDKASKFRHVLFAIAAALVLRAVSSPCLRAADEKVLPADLAQVPRDGGLFVTIRVGDVLTSKFGEQFLLQINRDPDNVMSALGKLIGVPLKDIERITILPMNVFIVRTGRPYDREKLIETLVPKKQEQTYKEKTYFQNDETATDLFLVNDQVFIKSLATPRRRLQKRCVREGA